MAARDNGYDIDSDHTDDNSHDHDHDICRDHTCGHVSGVANNDCRTVVRNRTLFGTLARFCLP